MGGVAVEVEVVQGGRGDGVAQGGGPAGGAVGPGEPGAQQVEQQRVEQGGDEGVGAEARAGRLVVSATRGDAPDAHFVTRFDRDRLAALVALVDRGAVVVDVSERHGLAEVHRRAEAGDLRGKVLVEP
ncbi:hypothetical protein ACIGNX_24350 [Actinosynnema sp. NPDC053489]|uniref:hypothetical protein n=1 Tax=Actinosynnema sp. NPDC053489 TaxID=3363916 RepID=UPI0037C814CC